MGRVRKKPAPASRAYGIGPLHGTLTPALARLQGTVPMDRHRLISAMIR